MMSENSAEKSSTVIITTVREYPLVLKVESQFFIFEVEYDSYFHTNINDFKALNKVSNANVEKNHALETTFHSIMYRNTAQLPDVLKRHYND